MVGFSLWTEFTGPISLKFDLKFFSFPLVQIKLMWVTKKLWEKPKFLQEVNWNCNDFLNPLSLMRQFLHIVKPTKKVYLSSSEIHGHFPVFFASSLPTVIGAKGLVGPCIFWLFIG